MTDINEELAQCDRLIQKLAALESKQDSTAFADEFRNLLNAVGSIRQYGVHPTLVPPGAI